MIIWYEVKGWSRKFKSPRLDYLTSPKLAWVKSDNYPKKEGEEKKRRESRKVWEQKVWEEEKKEIYVISIVIVVPQVVSD